MKISREQALANRERVVAKASELFRAQGFDGVGVAELMRAAGFTHGGFYNHFPTKEALAAEALTRAFAQMAEVRAATPDFAQVVAGYLSEASRKAPARSCPAAALGGDAARQPGPVREAFAAGIEGMIESFAAHLEGPDARARAIVLLAKMAGGLMLARAVPDGPLADELLGAVLADALEDLAPR